MSFFLSPVQMPGEEQDQEAVEAASVSPRGQGVFENLQLPPS